MTLREEVINLSEERKNRRQYLKKMDELKKAKEKADNEHNLKDMFGDDEVSREKAWDAWKTSQKLAKKINQLEYDEAEYDPKYNRAQRKLNKWAEQNIRSYNRNKPPRNEGLTVVGADYDNHNKNRKKIHYSDSIK